MSKPSPQTLMDAASISRTHAYDILAGRVEPSVAAALKIYDATGTQLGLLTDLTPTAIEQIRENAMRSKAA